MSDFWSKSRTARHWLFRVMAALLILANIEFALENTSAQLFQRPVLADNDGTTTLGMRVSLNSSGEPGWRWVISVNEAGAAGQAGIRPGDAVRFAHPWGYRISWQPGEEVPVTVARAGTEFAANLRVQQSPPQSDSLFQTAGYMLWPLESWIVIALSTVLLVRGRNNRAATMLGLTLLALRWPNSLAWLPDGTFAPLYLFTAWATCFFSYWALSFALEISGGAASRRQARFVTVVGGATAVLLIVSGGLGFFALPIPIDLAPISLGAVLICQLGAVAIIAFNYRRNNQATRNRIKIVFAAFGLFLLATIAVAILGNFVTDPGFLNSIYPPFSILAVGLLSYAVLKQRLFDFGFAINRTLVFGSVSFVLLAAFGVLEWTAERFVPEAWHEGGPFISAALALGLFLSFHRMRDWVEKHIERLFFHSWQQAEAALKRFVESAGHFDKMAKLCAAFTDALSRFAGGAEAALYLRETDGTYRQQAGNLTRADPSYGDDDPALALMRSERKTVELAQAHGALPGGLALPMLEQGTLTGFVLLAEKPDAARYRPDEVENLRWAAHQVGLDLRALHARQLEAENARLTALADERGRLLASLSIERRSPSNS